MKLETMKELLRVDTADWVNETEQTGDFFKIFGSRFPKELRDEHAQLSKRLGVVATVAK